MDWRLSFFEVFSYNFVLIFALFSWDTFFLDLIVIPRFRPKFLNIPEEMTRETMKQHAIESMTAVMVPLIIVVLLCTTISYFFILGAT